MDQFHLLSLRFHIPSMNLLKFIKSWFCPDKYNGNPPPPLRFIIIVALVIYVSGTVN